LDRVDLGAFPWRQLNTYLTVFGRFYQWSLSVLTDAWEMIRLIQPVDIIHLEQSVSQSYDTYATALACTSVINDRHFGTDSVLFRMVPTPKTLLWVALRTEHYRVKKKP
jgi:hypothetical protein